MGPLVLNGVSLGLLLEGSNSPQNRGRSQVPGIYCIYSGPLTEPLKSTRLGSCIVGIRMVRTHLQDGRVRCSLKIQAPNLL